MSHKRKNLLDELNKLAPSEAEKLINQYAKSKNKSIPKSLVITYAHDIEKHLDTVTVSCPYCQSTNIIKKGKIQHGLQRYQCKSCCKKFTKLTNTILEKSPWSWNVWTKVLYEMLHFSSVDLIMNTLINEHYVVEITKQTELPPQFCSNFNYLYVTEKGNIKKIIDNYNIKRKTDVLIHIYQIATNSSIDGSVLEDHEECSNKLIRHCYKKQQIVPLWIIPNALTMGELQTLFLMLPDEPQKKIISKIMNIDTTKVSSKNVVAFAGQIEQIRKLRNIVNHYEPVLPFLMSEIKTKKIEQSQLFTTLEILFKISPIVDIKPDEIQAKINPSNAKIIRILNVMYKSILS